MDDRKRRLLSQIFAVVIGLALILSFRGAFSTGEDEGGAAAPQGSRGECLQLAVTASSEKAALLGEIAADYNATDPQASGRCVNVVVTSKSSGATMDALARGWDESVDGPRPRRPHGSRSSVNEPLQRITRTSCPTRLPTSPGVLW